MKESFYFPHDYNARGDEKITALLRKHNWSGYGVYWALVEKLYEAGGRLSAEYESLGYDLRTEADFVRSVVENFGLFHLKEGKFRSRSIDRRLAERRQKSEKAKQSARFRHDANAQRPQCERTATAMLERKGKERKEIEERKGEESGAAATAPFQPQFCSYNDKGQGRCDRRKDGESKYCADHKIKVREKFLTNEE